MLGGMLTRFHVVKNCGQQIVLNGNNLGLNNHESVIFLY